METKMKNEKAGNRRVTGGTLSIDRKSSEVSSASKRSHRSNHTSRTSQLRVSKISVGAQVLEAAKKSEEVARNCSNFYDVEIGLLDPAEMTNEELREWIEVVTKNNKLIESEAITFEKYWLKTRQNTTKAETSRGSDSKTSLQEYEEIIHSSNQRKDATFIECENALQERLSSISGGKKSVTTMSIKGGSRAVSGGNHLFFRNSTSKESNKTTMSAMTGSSADNDTTLCAEQKLDIATVQLRRMKEERTARRKRHEVICRNKNSEIEQHKEHLKTLKKYYLLFTREHRRGGGMSGDAILKFYDDVIKHENHAIEIIRLSNVNLRTKGKYVTNNIRMREEGGDNFKLVDYQKLELMNDERQQVLTEQTNVLANQKKLLADCNFYCNQWRRRLTKVEEEGEKLNKEKMMRFSIIAQVVNEAKTVEATRSELKKEHDMIHSLMTDFVTPKVIEYVQEVATNHGLENDVRIWERKNNILRLSLQELTTTLKKLVREAAEDEGAVDDAVEGAAEGAVGSGDNSNSNAFNRRSGRGRQMLPPIGR